MKKLGVMCLAGVLGLSLAGAAQARSPASSSTRCGRSRKPREAPLRLSPTSRSRAAPSASSIRSVPVNAHHPGHRRSAKDADGKVRYVATFVITSRSTSRKASGLMWHDVPNRGRRVPVCADGARARRHRAGQRLAGRQRRSDHRPARRIASTGMQWLQVPVARDPGRLAGNRRGARAHRQSLGRGSQPLIVQTNPVPYKPASLDTAQVEARLARAARPCAVR